MNSHYLFRLATAVDDPQIQALTKISTIGNWMEIGQIYKSDFITSFQTLGQLVDIVLCEFQGEIIGMGVVSCKSVYYQGKKESLCYLSNLRIQPHHRSRYVLHRAFQYFIERYRHKKCLFITTIMNENYRAKAILTSARANMPRYKPLTNLTTFLLKQWSRPAASDVFIQSAKNLPFALIDKFIQDEGSKRDYFPCYTAEDFAPGEGILRGLSLDNLFVAIQKNHIVGMIGIWDQNRVKETIVTSYHPLLRLLRLPYNLISKLSPYPSLPAIGNKIPLFYAALVLIKDSQQSIFDTLMSHVVSLVRKTQGLLAIGLIDEDPLLQSLIPIKCLSMSSSVYEVKPRRENVTQWLPYQRSIRPIYLELGAL